MHLVAEVERVRDSRREGVAHAAVAPLLAQADAEDLFLFLKKVILQSLKISQAPVKVAVQVVGRESLEVVGLEIK